MTFLHLSLLAGTALVALPIVLHLIMRRRPTLVEFPAMRFLQKKADVNRRRLRLQHLLLLLLRAAVVAMLAFALARPSVKLSGAIGSQEAPVAAALVFDTAPHMEYRHENRTRLGAAQEFGQWLLKQLPEGSEIAVFDARPGAGAAFAADRGQAKERIARLEAAANAQSLPTVVEAAAKLLRQSDLRKEIYIFTDLVRGSWPDAQATAIQQAVAALGECGVYVIDVGVADPIDVGLDEARPANEVLSVGSTLGVETALTCLGPAGPRVVELYLLDADGKPQKRDQQDCKATPGESRPVEFRVGGLVPGVHQGFLRIAGQDGLAADDARYFTVEVKPAWRMLLAAPKPAESYSLFLGQALSPDIYRRRGKMRFDCETCELSDLARRPLDGYAVVCLLDPAPLEPAVWRRLFDFVSDGRGLAVFFGRNASPVDSFNAPQAQSLLPGKLLRQARAPDGDVYLSPRDFQHPVLSAFRSRAGAVPWDAFPVFRYWELDARPKGVAVIASYNDGRPAILERPVGRGRVLVMTTPVSDRPDPRQNPWNLLPAGEAWPFVMLANQMADYLAAGGNRQWNYLAGQTAVLPLDANQRRTNYMLASPDGLSSPCSADPTRGELSISTTDRVGNYRLRAGGEADRVDLGFSVNYAPDQTRLDRLSDRELAAEFGPVKFRLARTQAEIDRDVSQGRVGRELFPTLILIVALLLAAELVVANRFYKE